MSMCSCWCEWLLRSQSWSVWLEVKSLSAECSSSLMCTQEFIKRKILFTPILCSTDCLQNKICTNPHTSSLRRKLMDLILHLQNPESGETKEWRNLWQKINGISGRKIVEGKMLRNPCVPIQADNRNFQSQVLPHHGVIYFLLREWSHGPYNATWGCHWISWLTLPSLLTVCSCHFSLPLNELYHSHSYTFHSYSLREKLDKKKNSIDKGGRKNLEQLICSLSDHKTLLTSLL